LSGPKAPAILEGFQEVAVVFRWVFGLVLVVALGGCTGLPRPEAPSDCLVVVPVSVDNLADRPPGRVFSLIVSGKKGPILSNEDESFVTLVVPQPGMKITAIVGDVESRAVKGEGYSLPLDLALPYAPGALIVADFAFVITMEKTADFQYTNTVRVVPVVPSARTSFRSQYSRLENFGAWGPDRALAPPDELW
jgi:hypothetical protein